MNVRAAVWFFGPIVLAVGRSNAQTVSLPRTETAIVGWDAAIVRRAAAMIPSPAQWNRSDAGSCTAEAKTVSLRCALQRSIDLAVGRANGPVPSASSVPAPLSDCQFSNVGGREEGNCGPFFDESTVFSIARAKEV